MWDWNFSWQRSEFYNQGLANDDDICRNIFCSIWSITEQIEIIQYQIIQKKHCWLNSDLLIKDLF